MMKVQILLRLYMQNDAKLINNTALKKVYP